MCSYHWFYKSGNRRERKTDTTQRAQGEIHCGKELNIMAKGFKYVFIKLDICNLCFASTNVPLGQKNEMLALNAEKRNKPRERNCWMLQGDLRRTVIHLQSLSCRYDCKSLNCKKGHVLQCTWKVSPI